MKKYKNVKCERCGHEWKSKSVFNVVTCSSCTYKVFIKKLKVDKKPRLEHK